MSANAAPISPARVAVIQFDPQVGLEHCDNNLCHGLELAEQAVREGANLIVLPELANSGYSFNTRAEAWAHAEALADGPSLRIWAAFAREHHVYLVAGFAERDGLKLYDSAVLFGPEGLLGHYRKAHLWNQEKLWFSPGNLGFPVFETPIGRIGLLICWDIWFPEVPRLLAMTAAHVNNVHIAAANRIGSERGGRFLGCSLIAGTNGWPLGEIAGPEDQCILYADLDLSGARSAPIWNSLNDLPRDRRTDLYGSMLGYDLHPALPR
ncbi:nitrilase family protein [Pseudomonas sp. SBB6]|uniref:nitrilase family protein n=1 Tax=Pseudomonas sp. SBB6 TaxID=2962032 RepID=UPI0020B748C2|nr:nitrilase family protein [Pseudomonas sp. SBB6]MCP3753259.1 nitrilase family protein [Pseudomonas sp. SBB6]